MNNKSQKQNKQMTNSSEILKLKMINMKLKLRPLEINFKI